MEFGRWKLVIAALLIAAALVGLVLHGSMEVDQMGHPDWQTKTIITNSQLDVEVINSTLDVNVTNSVLNISGQVEVTNSELDVKVTNTSLDVNVTNSTLNVQVQGTADVEIQNAELHVKNLREQITDLSQLSGFNKEVYVSAGGTATESVYTNPTSETVFLEYLTIAADAGDPTKIFAIIRILDSSDSTVFTFYANGQLFMNFDPAVPIPAGGEIRVTFINNNSVAVDAGVSGIVRLIS